MDETVATVPTIRLIPPSRVSGTSWLIEDMRGPKRWKTAVAPVLILMRCLVATPASTVARDIVRRTGLTQAHVNRCIEALQSKGLLLSESQLRADTTLRRYAEILSAWDSFGWTEAAEYHLYTHDYPFLDYAAAAYRDDVARMRGYKAQSPEPARSKQYPTVPKHFAHSEIAGSQRDLESALGGSSTPDRQFTSAELLQLLTLCIGTTGTIPSRKYSALPFLLRTSPSGGSRHPTEGYILALDVPGIGSGWYHFDAVDKSLGCLSTDLPPDLVAMFPLSVGRSESLPDAIIVLTSVFRRNMYRYREPRTFRTVHMDAGHIAASIELAASAYGCVARVAYADDDLLIEEALGLDGLVEGYMLSVRLTQT